MRIGDTKLVERVAWRGIKSRWRHGGNRASLSPVSAKQE